MADSLRLMTTMRDGEGMGMVTFSFAGKTLYGNTGGSASTGAWLNYFPEDKLALAYTTNAKPYPVQDIVAGIFDIYWNRPYRIPAFDAFEVAPEILDRYVGVYSVPGAGNRANVTRAGATLYLGIPSIHPCGLARASSPAKASVRTCTRRFRPNPESKGLVTLNAERSQALIGCAANRVVGAFLS